MTKTWEEEEEAKVDSKRVRKHIEERGLERHHLMRNGKGILLWCALDDELLLEIAENADENKSADNTHKDIQVRA
jgi:hypothetical protein